MALLEQAMTRVKFNTDLRRLRLGLAENHLLARDVKNELQAGYRRELDALVEAEAASLIDQVYGRRFEQDVRPYLRQPQPVSGRQLRTILGAPQQGLVLDSLQLSAQQQAQAGACLLYTSPAARADPSLRPRPSLVGGRAPASQPLPTTRQCAGPGRAAGRLPWPDRTAFHPQRRSATCLLYTSRCV